MTEQDDQLHELVEKLNKSEHSRFRWVGVFSLVLISASIVGFTIYVTSANEENADLERANQIAYAENKIARDELENFSERLGGLGAESDPEVEELLSDLEKAQAILGENTEGARIVDGFNQIRLDIFYCSDEAGELEQLAYDLADTRPSSIAGNWRVRPISNEVNAQTRFRSQANEIRYDEGEEVFAVWLKERYEGAFSLPLSYRKISSQSADYVSVFFCDGANLPS